ncbi:Protein of unknown function (DUF3435) domain containing protein [Elaphomyces granulatus]
MSVGTHSHLSACVDEHFRDWRPKNFDISKQSTIWFILGPLTIGYKPVVSVEDLVTILHYHWCLDNASNPLLMLFITYTTGALIESGCLRGSNDTLCYKDIVLRVVPNPYQLDRHVLVMEVALLFMKGKRNKTAYIFHERDDNLALCPARGINSVEDVLRIQVTAPRNCLHLKWKPHMLNIPVFRQAIHTAEGIRIFPDKALPRGTANAVDTGCAICLSWLSRESIIQVVGRFSLTRDSRALKELSNEQKDAIERNPQLIKLCDPQRSLRKLIERKHGSVPKAKGIPLHREYTELGDTIRARNRPSTDYPLARNPRWTSDCQTEDQHEFYVRRVQTIQDWVSLCSLREGSRKRRVSSTDSGIDISLDSIIDVDTFPSSCPGAQCLFCLSCHYSFSRSRPDHLRRHIQDSPPLP